ncbi:hypothetical protein C7212DRAFT_345414 [Tuber magnatum]|uniref:FAS1 domain-containing protein n=1 Tax=Tuber magnatum TaxID=42249 RepID=A0A317SNX2_9PEZI|nr:hypothetical protein C7212DRAFT_345414 [Tuber magnatum]
MFKFIFLLCLATHMGSAHPGHTPERTTGLYVRQNNVISTSISFSTRIISGTSDSCNGCKPGTYCLLNVCCDNGMDPETCASNNGLKLSVSLSSSTRFLSSTQSASPRPSSGSSSSQSPSTNASPTSNSNASRTSTSNASRTPTSNASQTSSSSAGRSKSDVSRPSSSKASRSSSSGASKASSERPSTRRPEPSTYPTVNEDSVAPKEAAPVTTTYGPITATIANNPVTLAYSGEVLPLQTVANHKPAPSSFKDAVLAALAKDPDTKAFGDLLTQAPSVFEGLEENKEYYVFAPTTQFVIDFLKRMSDNPHRLARRKVFVDPNTSQQFAEKPKGAPDIKRVSSTLKTTLVGETKYVDLGASEGARVVSDPAINENGTVYITSGFGNSTMVHSGEIPFEGGIIKKCDGFFTLPQSIEAVFANTGGRLWSTALQKADMLTQLSEKRMVTIFAVQDSVLDEANLPGSADLNRLVYDGLSYSPDMSDGACLTTRGGGSLRITRNGNDILVNGVRLSTPNVIAKNGVIHYLEKIPPAEKCGGSGSSAGEQSVEKSAGAMVVVSKMAVLGLSVATLAVYSWM